ncbi:MAG: NAD(+)/NADH kinase [Anaerolineales bacterium]|nr:NAD(+)/NADH kinase [Anaerolineales bacterium]
MTSPAFLPRSFAVAAYARLPEAVQEAQALHAWLRARGLESFYGRLEDLDLRRRIENREVEICIAVGGDGTMLRAAHLCAPVGIPILGINFGRLGFLIQVQQREWPQALERLLQGDAWIEHRMMLQAEHRRSDQAQGHWYALNEIVVCRGALIRPIHVSASADGLIAATATGSTAYALAAGGPILPPELRNILLIPIAPHLSVDRAVVLSEGSAVTLTVRDGEAVLSVDGQAPISLAIGDEVLVRAGDYSAQFVRFGDAGYFYRNLTAYMNQNPSIGISR